MFSVFQLRLWLVWLLHHCGQPNVFIWQIVEQSMLRWNISTKMLLSIDFSAYFSCFFNQVCFEGKWNFFFVCTFVLGQIWGNLISYFILTPEEEISNKTISTNDDGKYNRCGVDFSEKEYKGAQVANQIERTTVWYDYLFYYLWVTFENFRLIFFVLFIYQLVFVQY